MLSAMVMDRTLHSCTILFFKTCLWGPGLSEIYLESIFNFTSKKLYLFFMKRKTKFYLRSIFGYKYCDNVYKLIFVQNSKRTIWYGGQLKKAFTKSNHVFHHQSYIQNNSFCGYFSKDNGQF